MSVNGENVVGLKVGLSAYNIYVTVFNVSGEIVYPILPGSLKSLRKKEIRA